MDWWLETIMAGFFQGSFFLPLTRTFQRGLNHMYSEPQKEEKRCRATRRRSNHLVSNQITKLIENMIMLDTRKNIQSPTLYIINPAFLMIFKGNEMRNKITLTS